MRRIIQNSHGHPLKNQEILQSNELSCDDCSQEKLIIRPSPTKVGIESPIFLERIHRDICGPISPPSGPFKYFMVLINASSDGHMRAYYQVEILHLQNYLLK